MVSSSSFFLTLVVWLWLTSLSKTASSTDNLHFLDLCKSWTSFSIMFSLFEILELVFHLRSLKSPTPMMLLICFLVSVEGCLFILGYYWKVEIEMNRLTDWQHVVLILWTTMNNAELFHWELQNLTATQRLNVLHNPWLWILYILQV